MRMRYLLLVFRVLAGLVLLHSVTVQAQPSAGEILRHVRIDASRSIDFHAAVFPDTVFVGQQATYQVAVILEQYVRGRLRRDPQFRPPELRSLIAYEIGRPELISAGTIADRNYFAHVFQRGLFGITPGDVTIPSPQLTYELARSTSYFSRSDQIALSAESLHVFVKPLPAENMPAGFSGAVGVLKASARIDADSARTGDPLTLTVRIAGTGNIKLLPRPNVEVSWASVVSASERIAVDSSGPLIRGSKEFDFILTPTRAGIAVLQPLRYEYFNPYSSEYETAETEELTVAVTGDPGIAVAERSAIQPLDLMHATGVGKVAGYDIPIGERITLAVLWAVALLAAGAGMVIGRRRKSGREMIAKRPGNVVMRETRKDDPASLSRELRRDLLASLADRLRVPQATLVNSEDLRRVLLQRGVTRSTTTLVVEVLDELALAGFGGTDTNADGSLSDRAPMWSERTARVLKLVDQEAVPNSRLPLKPGLRVLSIAGVLLGVGVSTLMPSTLPAQSIMASGASGGGASSILVEAERSYESRRYTAATEQFSEAVIANPRDVRLLADWGAAAWMSADTVSAVAAWQRAARLDPMSGEIQQRLSLLPPGARTGIASVPMIPVRIVALIATLCWCTGMSLLMIAHLRSEMRAHGLLRAPVGVAIAAVGVCLMVVAWRGSVVLDPAGLEIVRAPEPMRMEPGTDAAALGGTSTGDIVRVLDQRGFWSRIEHSDGRVGWIRAGILVPLLDDAARR